MKKISIIRFNDDNHAERIWANGVYLGNLNDIEFVLENFMEECNKEKFEEIESTPVWVCDDFEDIAEDIIDDLWDWFNTVEEMTVEQMKLVKEKQWERLHEII